MAKGPVPAPPRNAPRPPAQVVPPPAPSVPQVEEVDGATAIVRSLEEVGAEVVFGIPGGAILPTYDPLFD